MGTTRISSKFIYTVPIDLKHTNLFCIFNHEEFIFAQSGNFK